MSNQLQENLNLILEEKNTKLLPENLKAGITCLGVTGELEEGIDTSDATATLSDIVAGKTAYVDGEKITGNVQEISADDGVMAELSYREAACLPQQSIVAIENYLEEDTLIRANTATMSYVPFTEMSEAIGLTSDKIVEGNTILGVEGTAEVGGTTATKYAPKHISFYSYTGTDLDYETTNIDTSNVTSMKSMFTNCKNLVSLDLNGFNTENVTDMYGMFQGCNNLTSLNVSSFNTEKVTNMYGMFNGCNNLTSLDLSNFNTENVTDMYGMFTNCNNLISLDISSFNPKNVTTTYNMFYGCNNLTSLDLSNFDTGKVTSMFNMFKWCRSLTSLDLSKFNTENVTRMDYMFNGCDNLISLNISSFNTEKVTSMTSMFQGCFKLTSLDVSSFNTAKVTDMTDMFNSCYALTSLDISSFDFTNITKYTGIFAGIPTDCLIYVKDQTAKDWVLARKSDFTNVQIKNVGGGEEQ